MVVEQMKSCESVDELAVGFDFAVRIKGSPAVTPIAPCELDVLVQREFGLSHKNLQAG